MFSQNASADFDEDGYITEISKSLSDSWNDKKQLQSIHPVLIGQLNISKNVEHLTIFSAPSRIVAVVGVVRNAEDAETTITYEVEDETGSIMCVNRIELQKKDVIPILEMNTWVKIHGVLREENKNPCILIVRCESLKSLNELTSHLLEVLLASCKAFKDRNANYNKSIHDDCSSTSKNTSLVSNQQESQNMYDISGLEKIVYNVIKEASGTANGIHRVVLKEKVPKRFLPYLDKTLESLAFNGHIYTTITNDYFKTL